jgi:predicted enzyme related to lactoylglutathione lyase
MAKTAKRPAMKSAKKPAKAVVTRPHFASVAVVVADRRRSVKWYTERFGLDHLADMDHWQTVGEKGRPGELHICQVSEYDDKAPLEPGNSGIAFRLSGDFVAACAGLKAHGVDFAVPPTKSDWGWWAMAKDPDGNEICLVPAE